MEINVNFNALFNEIANNKLMEQKNLKPLIELLNKYGIYGLQAAEFLMEFYAVLGDFEVSDDDRHTTH